MAARAGWLLIPALLASGETIDRVAVVVGREVITSSAISQEIRVAAFLNGETPDTSAASRRKTAERMVDQTLVRGEMTMSQYPMPDAATIRELLAGVKAKRFPDEKQYREALTRYGITEEELLEHLGKQLATMQFIDLRFRPGIHLLEDELRDYYERRLLPELRKKNNPLPPDFDSVRDQIERILIEERINQALESWIKDARSRTRIEFKEAAFQ